MYRTAPGPLRAPSRKLSVISRGAPKTAAASLAEAAGSGDDARKGMTGGAKLGGGCSLIQVHVTVGQLQQRLYKAGQGKRSAMHRRAVDFWLRRPRLQAVAHAHFVEAGRID